MPSPSHNPRDMALTVEEREAGLFRWVLLEACEVQASEALHYRPRHIARQPQSSYSAALVLGVAALRRVAGDEAPAASG